MANSKYFLQPIICIEFPLKNNDLKGQQQK